MNINYNRIPHYMRYGTKLYVENGIPPGSFVEAVASGDLFQAVARADEGNAAALRDWVTRGSRSAG